MSDSPKLCRDCKWCERDPTGFFAARCKAPQNLSEKLSLVSGEMERHTRAEFCSTHRSTELDDRCGIPARWFEAREDVVPVVEFARESAE